jgi:hypothetical protein
MEITVEQYHMDGNICVIDQFFFTAFCLLGDDVEPCFESSALKLFELDECKAQFAMMMAEMKQELSKVSPYNMGGKYDNYSTKGGEGLLEQKIELLAKYGLTPEQVEFDLDALSFEELEAQLAKGNTFTLTAEQFLRVLIDALSEEHIDTEWGAMRRYCYQDHDTEAQEVYCWDAEDWKLYGFQYSMNGDNVVIDFESKKRKKFVIVDFDEGDVDISLETAFQAVATAAADAKSNELTEQFEVTRTELEGQYATASKTIAEQNQELEKLRQYQQEELAKERAADEDAVFAMFADLNGIEEFEALRADCADLSIDEIEEKCFALRGRNATRKFSSDKLKNPRLPIEKNKTDGEPYGGLFVEFPPHQTI